MPFDRCLRNHNRQYPVLNGMEKGLLRSGSVIEPA